MTQKELHNKVNEIHKILVGNGDIGLCEQVRVNKTDIGYLKEKVKDITNSIKDMPKNWRSWLVFGVSFITLLLLAYTTFKK